MFSGQQDPRPLVLGLAGSPRGGGNTGRLLEAFLSGVGQADVQVQTVLLHNKQIRPCTHCDGCIRSGRCVINDDMQAIYPLLEQAEVIAMASPVYFMAHCAQAKLLIDRCQVFWARRYKRGEDLSLAGGRKRQGVLIATGGTRGDKVFTGMKLTTRWWLDSLYGESAGELLFNPCDEKGAIQANPGALSQAKQLGESIGRSLSAGG